MPCMCSSSGTQNGSMLILEIANFTRVMGNCLHNAQGSLLDRALHLSFTRRIFLSMTGTCWPGGAYVSLRPLSW